MPSETSDREISADLLGKKRQGKMGKEVKIEKKRRKIVKAKVEIENGTWRNLEKLQNDKMRIGPPLFFFFFFFFFLLLTFQNN